MRKKITKPNTTREKVKIFCAMLNKNLSDNEINILSELIEMSQGNNITLQVGITKQIRETLSITASSFNTGISRLQEKKVITKSGKVIMLSPIFNNLSDLDGLVVEFVTNAPHIAT